MTQYSTVTNVPLDEDTNAPAISWAAIIAGSVVTITISCVLTLLGVGLGFAMTPSSPGVHTAVTMTVAAAVWMIIVQWFSSALGGFLAGRLRAKWPGLHTHEVFFRDTAHGFITWTVATLVLLGVFATTAASSIVQMPSQDTEYTAENGSPMRGLDPYLYGLFRTTGSEAATLTEAQRDESALLLIKGSGHDAMAGEDRAYLTRMVETHTGLSNADAEARVDRISSELKADADKARKATASATIIAVLSMMVGAFVSSVAGAIGGARRDEY